MTLLFKVQELADEAHAFRELASTKLYGTSEQVLYTAASQLDSIRKRTTSARWSIDPGNPVVTVPSVGHYMPGGEGALTVFAEIAFVWDLLPVRDKGDSRPANRVSLGGLASTSVRVYRGTPMDKQVEIAHWNMDVADPEAPGSYFHVQVGSSADGEWFPSSFDVPRLPGVLNSPFACMEFVLGELFQDEWPKIAMTDTSACRRWRKIQAVRHMSHLSWAAEQVNGASGSPWVMWKQAKPPARLFLTA